MRTCLLVLLSFSFAIHARRAQLQKISVENGVVLSPKSASQTLASMLYAVSPATSAGVRARSSATESSLSDSRAAHSSMHHEEGKIHPYVFESSDVSLGQQNPTVTPELYVYDHCPFCVRVRLALGILGKKHKLVFLENDDVETPTALVGKKISPIWVDEDGAMPESLDIIAKADTEKRIAPASGRSDFKAWQKSVQTINRKLQRPRYVMVPLPEFMKKGGRDAFVANHQMPPFEKSEWKGNPDFPLDLKYEKYKEAFEETDKYLPELNEKLLELEQLIHSPEACTEGIGVSYDDIDLWARLRSLTIIKGVQIPPKVRAYLDHFEKVGDVPLYDVMAV